MGRREQLQAGYELQKKRLGIESQQPAPAGVPFDNRKKKGYPFILKIILFVIIVGIIMGIWHWFKVNSQSNYVFNRSPNLIGSGTGFCISSDGWFLTAAHVVMDAKRVEIILKDQKVSAQIIRIDRTNDIALLKAKGSFTALKLGESEKVKLGESVFTVGFPLPEIQGENPKLTRGDISSLSGIKDDPRCFQISVPVQPGNSGGPLCKEDGSVIGMIVQRLNDKYIYEYFGTLPQNVNYAIKSSYFTNLFLPEPGVNGLKPSPLPPGGRIPEHVQSCTAIIASYGDVQGSVYMPK